MTENFYKKTSFEVLGLLGSRLEGLTKNEAKERLQRFGPNKILEGKRESLFLVFLRQLQSPLIYVLIGASLIVFLFGEIIDGSIILFVLVFNSILGTIQEGRAQNTLRALKNLVETDALVLRNNKEEIIRDTEVVPGDIIFLHEGDKVPADARIIQSNSLKVDEAALTGESVARLKSSEPILAKDLVAVDQRNMVFKGTHVLTGNGEAVVVGTGGDTFIGKISKQVSQIDTEIPLKTNIRYLSKVIVFTVFAIGAILFFAGLGFGKTPKEMFGTVVSLAVSIIPEGLPIVITIVLATGVFRMSRRNALVKRLQAVEALGQARVIAVDKTGTITKNELIVRKVFSNGKMFEVAGSGYEPKGEINFDGKSVLPLNHPELILAGKVAAFCGNAKVAFLEKENLWRVAGDPTEAALLVFAEKIGFQKNNLEIDSPLINEAPFNYKTRYHATSHEVEGKQFIAVAGAPESIIDLSGKFFINGEIKPFTKEEKIRMEKLFHEMSREGLRVVAFGFSEAPLTKKNKEEISLKEPKKINFLGFYGLEDSLRPEVKTAVLQAKEAGIRVIMITGDHRITAEAIAKEAGIFDKTDKTLTGEDLTKLNDEELRKIIGHIKIFARISPENKMRIIEAFRARGEVVAMTGDGVNDAPSLVAADLGVAMGKIGTEVAKEAADIILLDDNFGSIVSAIEEGRSIYKTIKKVILYLFSTSIGEVLVISGAIFLGYPLPLLPAQIIWLNLVTDSFLDASLAMEPKEKNLLKAKFEKPKKYLVDKLMLIRMGVMAFPMMFGTLFFFGEYLRGDLVKAWTISLTTLAVFQWFNAWNCRSESESIFNKNIFSNKFLIGATFIVIGLQLVAVYAPFMQKILRTTALSFNEWGIIILIASSVVLFEEVRKILIRKVNG